MIRQTTTLFCAAATFLAACREQTRVESRPVETPAHATPSTPAKATRRYTFVVNTLSPFWEPMRKGMEKAANETGFQVDLQAPREANPEEQISVVEGLIAKGVDGIAISPISEQSLVPVLRKAALQGIAVICIDSDAPATGRAVYMGTFNREAGLAAGRALAEALPSGGKVAAFVGSMAASNSQERWGGAREACEKSALEFLGVPNQDKGLADKAQDNVAAVLQRNPDLAGILAIWSYNGPAAARAVKAAGREGKVKIIAFDAEPQTLEFIEQGLIEATVVQHPFVWGYEGVKLLHRVKTEGRDAVVASLPENGQLDRARIDTGIEVVRKKDLPAYRESLRKMGL